MLKYKQIKLLEEENKRLEGETQRLMIENEVLHDRIERAIEYINKFESIKAYFEYTDEDGYDEYDYDDEFRNDLLNILKGDSDEF